MSDDGELPLVRRTGKSEAAFRTISEVADELDVPQHVLRFWESKFPQVKPLKRGGGRRYYRPEDVALLRRIRDLLYAEGYTIKGVQKLLREGGARDVVASAGKPELEEAELPLGGEAAGEPDFPELNDGEEDDETEMAALAQETPARAPSPERIASPNGITSNDRFTPETRRELNALLAELEQLRGLLQPR